MTNTAIDLPNGSNSTSSASEDLSPFTTTNYRESLFTGLTLNPESGFSSLISPSGSPRPSGQALSVTNTSNHSLPLTRPNTPTSFSNDNSPTTSSRSPSPSSGQAPSETSPPYRILHSHPDLKDDELENLAIVRRYMKDCWSTMFGQDPSVNEKVMARNSLDGLRTRLKQVRETKSQGTGGNEFVDGEKEAEAEHLKEAEAEHLKEMDSIINELGNILRYSPYIEGEEDEGSDDERC
ncbi:hypothetical protein BCR39DRAFT_557142 [Naematelia encephala]|uniref:Uncharacterized protein n=1 Tax=Naematelia encephala TaxID=71784 RepID=A0A1Y2BG41_9TREE|nr:hypothetical protein BCR39DRAFT_557142 [Naematelia encephala]